MNDRKKMNGKEVRFMPTKTVINFKSGFEKKLLCDGPTFTTGTACAYSCSFCYVPSAMLKLTKLESEEKHMDVVIRRENALDVLQSQLRDAKGRPKFLNDGPKVIYASPLVDVAANMDLVRETVEACKIILADTSWHIRLLSKSNLLPMVADGLEGFCGSAEARDRIVYGFSTGTFSDDLAKAFEAGTPRVSKRIEALHQLQDAGYRTFGMVCPSLPHNNYMEFAREAADKIRIEKCEHVWAEVLNVRGKSMTRTIDALLEAGFDAMAAKVEEVSQNKQAWEFYARETFSGYALDNRYRGKLRFLQYVNKDNLGWWKSEEPLGAVLL